TNSSLEENGGRNGGAIDNRGTLSVSGCSFEDNSASLGNDIRNLGMMTVTGSTFQIGFFAVEPQATGGSIANFGNAVLDSCSISYLPEPWLPGPGVFNQGSMTISNSTISGFVSTAGGGIDNAGILTLSASTVTGNQAQQEGGGIYNTGTLYV